MLGLVTALALSACDQCLMVRFNQGPEAAALCEACEPDKIGEQDVNGKVVCCEKGARVSCEK